MPRVIGRCTDGLIFSFSCFFLMHIQCLILQPLQPWPFFCKFNLQIIPKFNPGQKPVMLLNGMRQDEPIA